jgi:GNAT superfamily N-acetyltransferase
LPQDKPAILSFIDGIQTFENPIEGDRRTDARVAEDYFPEVLKLAARGASFIAEDGDTALGWALVHRDTNEVYVKEGEREIASVRELYVAASARGAGVGQALIAACEDWAKAQGIKVVMIGVLPGNERAVRIYRDAGFSPYALQLRKYVL